MENKKSTKAKTEKESAEAAAQQQFLAKLNDLLEMAKKKNKKRRKKE